MNYRYQKNHDPESGGNSKKYMVIVLQGEGWGGRSVLLLGFRTTGFHRQRDRFLYKANWSRMYQRENWKMLYKLRIYASAYCVWSRNNLLTVFSIICLWVTRILRGVLRKKTGLCGKNSQAADPPTPPSLGNPCYQKKSWVYFSF